MTRLRYPPAEAVDVVDHLHGRRVADPYRWLEDVDDPRTAAWRAAQDALCREHLDALPGRERLRRRLTDLLDVGAVGPPVVRAGRAFWTQRDPGQDHAVLRWSDGDGEHVLLDPASVDPSGLTTLDAWSPSPDGRRVAHQLSTGGDEESLLRVVDVETGEVLDGPVDRCRYSPVAWAPDGESLHYVRRLPPGSVPPGEEQFHRRVFRHRVGAPTGDDVEVWGAGLDPTNYYGLSASRDGRWLVVSASAGTAPRADVWLFDLAAGGEPAPVQVGVDAHCSAEVGRDGRLWLLTDREAPRGRLCVAPPERPGEWTTVLPEHEVAVLEDVVLADGDDGPVLVALRARHAVSEVAVHDVDGTHLRDVALPGHGTVTALTAPREGGPHVWLGWTSSTAPPSSLRLDVRTGEVVVERAAPGAPDVAGVVETVLTTTSVDGTTVRMRVLAPCAEPDRPRPAVLYGYGGFGVSLTPAYTASALAWVEAGGVWAVANLRGGAEEGEQWHRAGMREHKQNVFDDFACCAETLVTGGWTRPEQLGLYGGSNGGLLVGAALTQRPASCAAVVCSAPLLDMVRYERFGLGRTWNDEYGTADDPEELGWLLSYSPYHAVRAGTSYPAVLFTVFDGDSRVDPLHARKTCAALQAATSSDAPVLLRDERDVGHGARSVRRTVGLSVDVLSFLAARTGLELEP